MPVVMVPAIVGAGLSERFDGPIRVSSLTETLLRVMGLCVWLFAGTPTSWRLATHPAQVASPQGVAWLVAYGVFGAAFWIATAGGSLRGRRLALSSQSAAAIALCFLGMPEFEGALLAVVAAQAPNLFPLPVAAIWLLGQGVPLFAAVFPTHGWLRSIQATGAYLSFGAFAMGAVYLRQREVRARFELGQLNGELLSTQHLLADSTRLAERLRISRDLHDVIGHHLIALNLQLELEQQRVGEGSLPVTEARGIVRRMLSDVRGVVSVLRSDAGLDVGSALRTLAGSIPEPRIHLELAALLDRVDPERGHALFRCVQEAVTNAVKHGGAQNVWIRMERTAQTLRLHVEDDGCGAGDIPLGNGLRGMRERLEQMGGALSVSSVPGSGFSLRVSIPMAAESP